MPVAHPSNVVRLHAAALRRVDDFGVDDFVDEIYRAIVDGTTPSLDRGLAPTFPVPELI